MKLLATWNLKWPWVQQHSTVTELKHPKQGEKQNFLADQEESIYKSLAYFTKADLLSSCDL